MKRIVFIGAGAHLAVVAEAARLCGHTVVGVLDAGKPVGSVAGTMMVLGSDDEIARLAAPDLAFHIAITAPDVRERLREHVGECGGHLLTLTHPAAIVSPSAQIGVGCFVAAGAIVGTGVLLCANVVLNTGAQIDHDCRIGPDSHIAPGAVLAGGIVCGAGTFISSGAIVIPNVRIGHRCVVGAGATVLHDVPDGARVFGTPARRVDNGQ